MMMNKRLVIKGHDGQGEFSPQACYDYRVKIETDDLKRKGMWESPHIENVMGHENEMLQWNLKDMEMVEKLNKNVAIIVPSHSNHIPWLKACLESCRETGYYTLLVMDNPFWKYKDYDRVIPPQVLEIADSIIIKQRTFRAAVGVCHYWNMIYGLTVLKEMGFPIAFNINGDCIMEKPKGVEKIIEMLGDSDLFPNQYIEGQRYCGTMGWIGKVDVMLDFFHTYREEDHMYARTTEGRLWFYVKDHNLKVVEPVNCEHNYRIPSSGTWYDVLGFRHLHAEDKVRPSHGLPPVEEKYIYKG